MSYFTRVLKANPYHDPKSGRFTTAAGATGGYSGMTQREKKLWASTSGYVGPLIPPFSKPGAKKLSSPAGMKYTPPKKGVYPSTDAITGERIENEFERTPTGQYAQYERHGMEDKKTFLGYLTPTQFRNKIRLFHGEVFA